MLEVLANAGAPLENRSPDGYMPIHWAVKSGNYDAMMFLINKGVDVNAKCGQGYSVLDWATNEGYTRLIKALKKHGAKNTAKYKIDSRGK
jgi:ankyrin repeat protein